METPAVEAEKTTPEVETKPAKKRRGRPRKNPIVETNPVEKTTPASEAKPAKRRRGRPRKNSIDTTATETVTIPVSKSEKPEIQVNVIAKENPKTKPVEQTSLEVLVEAINNLTREVKILRRHLNK